MVDPSNNKWTLQDDFKELRDALSKVPTH